MPKIYNTYSCKTFLCRHVSGNFTIRIFVVLKNDIQTGIRWLHWRMEDIMEKDNRYSVIVRLESYENLQSKAERLLPSNVFNLISSFLPRLRPKVILKHRSIFTTLDHFRGFVGKSFSINHRRNVLCFWITLILPLEEEYFECETISSSRQSKTACQYN